MSSTKVSDLGWPSKGQGAISKVKYGHVRPKSPQCLHPSQWQQVTWLMERPRSYTIKRTKFEFAFAPYKISEFLADIAISSEKSISLSTYIHSRWIQGKKLTNLLIRASVRLCLLHQPQCAEREQKVPRPERTCAGGSPVTHHTQRQYNEGINSSTKRPIFFMYLS